MKAKKELRKVIVSLLIVSGMITSMLFAVTATSIDYLDNEPKVIKLLSSLNESGDFSNVKVLKDANDENRYYYLPFSSGGYLIYDIKLDIISEYSTSSNNDYIESTDVVYYTGALQYFTETNDNIVEIATGDVLGSKESFVLCANDINEKVERNYVQSKANLSDTKAAHYVSGTVPNYSHNPDGICGSTAAAMLLRWHDIYKNGKYVPSSLESENGVVLIEHLRGYIDRNNPGSTAGDVFTGIMKYCSSQGISHPGGMDNYSDNYVIGRVDTYRTPFLLLIYRHPKYHDHWITGYGYNISDGTCYSIVNDGWGNTGVSINPVYASQIVW